MSERRLPTLRLSSAELVARLVGPAERALRMACTDLGIVPAVGDALASEAELERVPASVHAERAAADTSLTLHPSRAMESVPARSRTPIPTSAPLPRSLDPSSAARTSRPSVGESEVEPLASGTSHTTASPERPRLRVRASRSSAAADSVHAESAALASVVPTTTVPSSPPAWPRAATTPRILPHEDDRVLVSVVRPAVVETKLERILEASPSPRPVEGPRSPRLLAPDHEPALAPDFAELTRFDEPKSPSTASSSPTTGIDEHALAAMIAAAARRHGIEIL